MRHIFLYLTIMIFWVASVAAQTEEKKQEMIKLLEQAASAACWMTEEIEDPSRCLLSLQHRKIELEARKGDRVSETELKKLKATEKWLKEKTKPQARRQKVEHFNARQEIEVAGRVQLVCPAAAGTWTVVTNPVLETGMITKKVYVEPRAAETNTRGLIRSVEILLHNNTASAVDVDSTAWGPIVRGLCPGGRLRLRLSDYYLSFANSRQINLTAIKADDGRVIGQQSIWFDRNNTWTPVEARTWVLY